MAGWSRRAGAGAIALVTLWLPLGMARAEGLALQLAPGFDTSSATATDAAGNVTHSTTTEFAQRYRGTFDRDLWPHLRLSAGGLYERRLGTVASDAGSGDSDAQLWTANGRLSFGGPFLSGALGYDRHEDSSEQRVAGVTQRAPGAVRDAYSAFLAWLPAELPTLDLRLARTSTHDAARQVSDQVLDEATLSSQYSPSRQLDVRYSLHYTDATDHLHETDSREATNSARATWSDTFFSRRLSTSATYTLANRSTTTTAIGAGGTIAALQPVTAGLSAIEAFPATPTRVALVSNPALIDGDTAASAGIDLGFGPALAGDVAARDLGAQFANAVTPVNTVYVWVDRQVQANVAAAVAFDAFQSDDNLNWSAVASATPPAGGAPVQFSAFQNRFEIAIATTSARYLKVVARPLGVAVTVDPRFRNILVTEVQFLTVSAARTQSTVATSGILTTTARYLILRAPSLSYDFSGFLTHADNPAHKTYAIVNGLSLSRSLGPIAALGARVERTDSDEGTGRSALTRLSASVTANPLPTVSGTISYSGQLSELPAGTAVTNGIALFDRLDLYQGVSLSSNASYSLGRNEVRQTTTSALVGANASVIPNRVLSLTGSYVLSSSSVSGGGRPEVSDARTSVEANATFSPVPALYVSGGVSRFVSGNTPATLANFSVNAAPFPGGDLLLRFGYSETLDTAARSRTRAYGPGLRWNIRAGWYLDTVYNVTDSTTPALATHVKSFAANLVISLR